MEWLGNCISGSQGFYSLTDRQLLGEGELEDMKLEVLREVEQINGGPIPRHEGGGADQELLDVQADGVGGVEDLDFDDLISFEKVPARSANQTKRRTIGQ